MNRCYYFNSQKLDQVCIHLIDL